jgi:TRAP-type C4-dicarboxylate transport system substrate-binding protein
MLTRIRVRLPILLIAALLVLPGWGLAAKQVWNFNMFGGKRAVTRGIETVADIFAKESNGDFELKIHYGSALGPEKQIPEGIKIGAFEAGQICVGYYPNKFPLLSVMELPFLAPGDLRVRAKVDHAILNHPAIAQEMEVRWDVKFFSPILLPAYEFMGNRRIQKAEDMKGVKMRISGLNARALEVFGAVPTMVTAPEGYQALDRGTIDMFGFPWTYAFGAYKLHEVSKYATEGLGMSGFMCFQGANKAAYEKLPDNLKKRLSSANDKAIDAMITAYEEADQKWLPEFNKRLEVVKISAAERDKIAKGSEKFWQEWAKEQNDAGRPGTEILEFAKAQIAKYSK